MALTLPPPSSKGERCRMNTILAAAGPKDRATIEAWLADQTIEHARIARAIDGQINGIRVSATSVSRHRRGECQCGK